MRRNTCTSSRVALSRSNGSENWIVSINSAIFSFKLIALTSRLFRQDRVSLCLILHFAHVFKELSGTPIQVRLRPAAAQVRAHLVGDVTVKVDFPQRSEEASVVNEAF